MDDCEDKPGIRYLKGNAKDLDFLEELLAQHFDAIVDYMIYGTEEFRGYWERFLKNTDHYIFLSSYRVYADEDPVITERSPRLLDVSKNTVYLESDDYSLFKAQGGGYPPNVLLFQLDHCPALHHLFHQKVSACHAGGQYAFSPGICGQACHPSPGGSKCPGDHELGG